MNINKSLIIGKDPQLPFTANRIDYGTMRLTGKHFFGELENRLETLEI